MQINSISSYNYNKNKTNSKTKLPEQPKSLKPSFKQIKVVPTYWESVEKVLKKRDMYKLVAVRENLTKFYIDSWTYYNMKFSVPTILQMLDAPETFEVSVDCQHMDW